MRRVLLCWSTGGERSGWERWLVPIALVAAISVMGGLAVLLDALNLDVWLAILTFGVLIAVAVPTLRWVARTEGVPGFFDVLMAAFVTKLTFALIRYYFIEVVYSGEADSGRYDQAGRWFLERLVAGKPIHPIPILSGFPQESIRIGDITGIVYLFTGPSAYSGYFAFSAWAFMGQLLMWRALRLAVPEADHRRYAYLVFFLPSLLFWPSSLGKEAVMIGCLGLLTYGAANLLAPRPRVRGAAYFSAGIVLVLLIRPHVALMSFGSLVVAVAVGVLAGYGSGGMRAGRGRVVRIAALIGLLLAAGLITTRVSSTFKSYDTSGSQFSRQGALEKTLEQTSVGGSEFSPITATSGQQLVPAIVSVTFRPFPWEARTLNSLIAGAESALLVALFAVSWRRVITVRRLVLRRPFLVFIGGYVVAFSVGFSFIANFGILARQRTQMLPMVLMLLALTSRSGRGDAEAGGPPTSGAHEASGTLGSSSGAPERTPLGAVAGVRFAR